MKVINVVNEVRKILPGVELCHPVRGLHFIYLSNGDVCFSYSKAIYSDKEHSTSVL